MMRISDLALEGLRQAVVIKIGLWPGPPRSEPSAMVSALEELQARRAADAQTDLDRALGERVRRLTVSRNLDLIPSDDLFQVASYKNGLQDTALDTTIDLAVEALAARLDERNA